MQKLESGELRIVRNKVSERKNPPPNALPTSVAPFSEDFIAADAATNDEVVRCHRFLQADGVTPIAGRLPDPKEINWKGVNYHQTGRDNKECAHCAAGISTYSDVQK